MYAPIHVPDSVILNHVIMAIYAHCRDSEWRKYVMVRPLFVGKDDVSLRVPSEALAVHTRLLFLIYSNDVSNKPQTTRGVHQIVQLEVVLVIYK